MNRVCPEVSKVLSQVFLSYSHKSVRSDFKLILVHFINSRGHNLLLKKSSVMECTTKLLA